MGVLNLKKPIVVSAYSCSGKTWIIENIKESFILPSDLEVIELDYCDYKFEERFPSELEVANYNATGTYENTLIGQDYFTRKFANTKKLYPNKDWPGNFIQEINESTADAILVDSAMALRQILSQNGIEYVTAYPKMFMKNEWVGRAFLNDKNPKIMARHWEYDLIHLKEEPHGKRIYWIGRTDPYLESTLLDVIHDYVDEEKYDIRENS